MDQKILRNCRPWFNKHAHQKMCQRMFCDSGERWHRSQKIENLYFSKYVDTHDFY